MDLQRNPRRSDRNHAGRRDNDDQTRRHGNPETISRPAPDEKTQTTTYKYTPTANSKA